MKITIPTPCHENWQNMTPNEKGRFCSVCSKTVRDFTDSSDEEIVAVFFNATERSTCGNFNESQLNRDLQYSFINSLFTKFAVGFILTTGGFVSLYSQNSMKNDSLKVADLTDIQILPEIRSQKNRNMMRGAYSTVYRGDVEPLYILNRKIIDYKTFASLNPNSIKDMTVLKDDSAIALYGERGRNGVIIIKSKRKFK